jgi:subtilase family serine protease
MEVMLKGKKPDGQNDCDPGKNDVTVQVNNQGGADAGRFAVALLVDGELNDGGKESVPALASGQQRQVRFDNVNLSKGPHTLLIQVDADGQIAESDEANNGLPVQVSCKNED